MGAGLHLVTSLPVFVWLCIWKSLDCDLFPTRSCFSLFKKKKKKKAKHNKVFGQMRVKNREKESANHLLWRMKDDIGSLKEREIKYTKPSIQSLHHVNSFLIDVVSYIPSCYWGKEIVRDSLGPQQMKPFMTLCDFMLISTVKIQHAKGKGSRTYRLCVILLGGYFHKAINGLHSDSQMYTIQAFCLFHIIYLRIEERLLNIKSPSSRNSYILHNSLHPK